MEVEVILAGRINLPEVRSIVAWANGLPERLSRLWRLACGEDRRTGVNALWVMSHLPEGDAPWIVSLRDEMIDRLLNENDASKKRLLLELLRGQDYKADEIRTDFLDFCLSKINSEAEPYAVRCFCIYTVLKMCRHFPELISELEGHLDLMDYQELSPGLKSAVRQTKAKIKKCKTSL
ncbi:MAG: hypothetical protein K2J06_01675 [Muribaculaceae bacterium]|nr:hypothetical protein [Muribaculaceae bacterium]